MATDGANTKVNGGDEVLSTSVSASIPDAHSAPASDTQPDNRISEMVDNNASEKCNNLLVYLFITLCCVHLLFSWVPQNLWLRS